MLNRMPRRAPRPRSVAHVSSAHPWTDNRVHLREAKSLAQAGYDVQLYALESPVQVAPTGVAVTTVKAESRVRRFTIGTVRALRFSLNSNASVIHLHDPEMLWTIPLLRLSGRSVIYDAHEDLPAQIIDKDYIPDAIKPVFVGATKAVLKLANFANQVVAATETVAQRFPDEKTTIVRNYPTLSAENFDRSSSRRCSVVYVGGLSPQRGLAQMVQMAGQANFPPGWKLELAGWGSQAFIEELHDLPGWSNTLFHGRLSPADARRLIDACSVGIVTLLDSPAHRDALPTKMFEYMAAGIPVVASDFPLWRSIVERYNCGMVVDPTSPEAIAGAVRAYADDSDLRRFHGENAQRAVRDFLNWKVESEGLVAMYDRLSADAGGPESVAHD